MSSLQAEPATKLNCAELSRLLGVPHSMLTFWVREKVLIPDSLTSGGKVPLFDQSRIPEVLAALRGRVSARQFELISLRVRSLSAIPQLGRASRHILLDVL
jgi:hypothetical protein